VRGSVYCTASFSVCSLRRAKFATINPDLQLDYKVATHPVRSPCPSYTKKALDQADRTNVQHTAHFCVENRDLTTKCPATMAELEGSRDPGTCWRLKIPVRDSLGSVVPGLGDFPINRIAELTPASTFRRSLQLLFYILSLIGQLSSDGGLHNLLRRHTIDSSPVYKYSRRGPNL
jgi:hypothetical protein